MSSKFTLTELAQLASSDGQKFVVEIIRKAIDDRGKNWLTYIRDNHPRFVYFANLIANHNAERAIEILKADYPFLHFVPKNQINQIKDFHKKVRNEIDRSR